MQLKAKISQTVIENDVQILCRIFRFKQSYCNYDGYNLVKYLVGIGFNILYIFLFVCLFLSFREIYYTNSGDEMTKSLVNIIYFNTKYFNLDKYLSTYFIICFFFSQRSFIIIFYDLY